MPSIDLTQGPHTLSRYDVVGERDKNQTHFVIHVGMLDEDSRSVKAGGKVSAVHMKPPLAQRDSTEVHVAGTVPLTRFSTGSRKLKMSYHNRGKGSMLFTHPGKTNTTR